MNKINTQIVDISCLCMVCATPITKMVLFSRLENSAYTNELENIATCYNCQLNKLANKKKVGI